METYWLEAGPIDKVEKVEKVDKVKTETDVSNGVKSTQSETQE